jgi:hypothetical protein
MLAKGELTLFGIICTVCYQLNIIPIKYNTKSQQVSPCNTSIRRLLYIISRIFSLFYFAFAVLRIYPAYKGFGTKYPIYYPIFHAIQIVLHIFTVMFDTVIAAYVEEIVVLFNQLVFSNRALGI